MIWGLNTRQARYAIMNITICRKAGQTLAGHDQTMGCNIGIII